MLAWCSVGCLPAAQRTSVLPCHPTHPNLPGSPRHLPRPRSYSRGYINPSEEQDLPKVAVDAATLEALQALARAQGKSVAHVASEALQQLASK